MNFNNLVYLVGPITGTSYGECTDWRKHAVIFLAQHGLVGVNPMRSKDYLQQERIIGDSYPDTVLSCGKGITTRDRYDCTRAGLILANFVGAEKVSIGSVMEVAWADLNRIPIVAAMEPTNIHQHSMMREAIGFNLPTLEEALEVAVKILRPSYYDPDKAQTSQM